jgi:Bleomycin resistance protein-like N-terminal
MSSNEVRSNEATGSTSVANLDMKLEVVVIPVSDVDRAKEFYSRLGWRLEPTALPVTTSVWSSSRLPVPAAQSNSA